jgi:hypothetical protein
LDPSDVVQRAIEGSPTCLGRSANAERVYNGFGGAHLVSDRSQSPRPRTGSGKGVVDVPVVDPRVEVAAVDGEPVSLLDEFSVFEDFE